MTRRSSSSDVSGLLFWRITLGMSAVFTALWLYPAVTDWIPRAFRGYGPFPDLDNYGLVDTVALWVLKHHVWLLVIMAFLNVLSVGIFILGTRRLPITIPTMIYVGMFVTIGIAVILADLRLYYISLHAGDEAFILTLMWCLLAAPLWILVVRAVWKLFGSRLFMGGFP